jgi:hypothetical protein
MYLDSSGSAPLSFWVISLGRLITLPYFPFLRLQHHLQRFLGLGDDFESCLDLF